MNKALNPRSSLHALKPYGCGTADVETLLSYFCRVAVSHSVSVASLARTVANVMGSELREGFDWHERNLSGLGAAAQTWSSGLSAMTGLGNLDHLTLSVWRDVLAPTGLAAPGGGRWCPACFEDDRLEDRSPYFRLAWDIGAVKACSKHGTQLVDVCPDCGRTGTRHKATYVVPGWCTHCGAFLGNHAKAPKLPANSGVLWVADQVGQMLAVQARLTEPPPRSRLQDAIRELIARLDGGKGAAFAKRIGVSKGAVHYWTRGDTIPTLGACLRTSAQSGLPLVKLLTGDLRNWEVPDEIVQLDLDLGASTRREARRELDWNHIREELRRFTRLPSPVSVAEVARQLEVDTRQLYLKANAETRLLGERWKAYEKRRREASQAQARSHVEDVCRSLREEGRAINLREVEARLPRQVLGSVEHLFDVLKDIRLENEGI